MMTMDRNTSKANWPNSLKSQYFSTKIGTGPQTISFTLLFSIAMDNFTFLLGTGLIFYDGNGPQHFTMANWPISIRVNLSSIKAGDWAAINGIYIILANSNGNSNSLWNWILLVMANSNWQMAGFSFFYGNGPQYFQCENFMMSDSFIHGAWAIDSTFHS